MTGADNSEMTGAFSEGSQTTVNNMGYKINRRQFMFRLIEVCIGIPVTGSILAACSQPIENQETNPSIFPTTIRDRSNPNYITIELNGQQAFLIRTGPSLSLRFNHSWNDEGNVEGMRFNEPNMIIINGYIYDLVYISKDNGEWVANVWPTDSHTNTANLEPETVQLCFGARIECDPSINRREQWRQFFENLFR